VRRCNIPPPRCRHRYVAPCCVDCGETDCPVRCMNSPDRCRCWEEGPAVKERKLGRRVDTARIAQLYDQGLTQAQIAEQVGCCKQTVLAVLRELGVEKHGKS